MKIDTSEKVQEPLTSCIHAMQNCTGRSDDMHNTLWVKLCKFSRTDLYSDNVFAYIVRDNLIYNNTIWIQQIWSRYFSKFLTWRVKNTTSFILYKIMFNVASEFWYYFSLLCSFEILWIWSISTMTVFIVGTSKHKQFSAFLVI